MTFIAILLIGFMNPAPAPKPPVIPDQLKAAFFKAEAQLLQAQAAAQKAVDEVTAKQGVLSGAIGDLSKFCGTGHEVKWDDKQEPACVAKIPVVNKAPEVKKP